MTSPLLSVRRFGQSFWLDTISRDLVRSGELARLVREDGIRGVTSNPVIFRNAIGESDAYDDAARALIARGVDDPIALYEALAVEDIQLGADALRPLHQESRGEDGWVSLEVNPHLANDTRETIREARRLRATVDRPNVMIKVPATAAGVPAIEQLTAEAIPVNVTLLFSVEVYERVARAYMTGIETLLASGGDIRAVASVASFFVSRIDTAVDRAISDRLAENPDEDDVHRLAALQHRVAITSAKLAYERFEALFGGQRFQALALRGARVQRLLWASTGTKDPALSPTLYVDALMGRQTVNTLPTATLEAFRASGHASDALGAEKEKDRRLARADRDALGELGIDLPAITERLLDEGCALFCDAFDELLATLDAKRMLLAG